MKQFYKGNAAVGSCSGPLVTVHSPDPESHRTGRHFLNAVPVLAESQSEIGSGVTATGNGEARESTNTKLKRPVEQVASGTRGGVQQFPVPPPVTVFRPETSSGRQGVRLAHDSRHSGYLT